MELPVLASVDWAAAALSALALLAVFRWQWGMVTVLGGSAALGLALWAAGLA
jgi:chromate transporter